jgi:hypothetical protein
VLVGLVDESIVASDNQQALLWSQRHNLQWHDALNRGAFLVESRQKILKADIKSAGGLASSALMTLRSN